MTSIQQLNVYLASSGDQPPTNLATYFKVGLEFLVMQKNKQTKKKLGTGIIVVNGHVVLSIELHRGADSGCSEASGHTRRGVQSQVWPGCRPPLRGARQTGIESRRKEQPWQYSLFVMLDGVLLFSFRGLTLE